MASVQFVARPAGILLDLLLPPLCLACRRPVAAQGGLCAECWGAIHFLTAPCCPRCGEPFAGELGEEVLCGACLAQPPAFDRARAVFRYDDASKGLVLSFKHADRPGLARFVAPWMARAAGPLLAEAELIVPVPLHRWRLLHRRYNQAALLAMALARRSGVPCMPDLLRRARRTPPQGTLSREARARNVKGAIRLGKAVDSVREKRILLVDDVLTTGATLGECVRVLRSAGAARIDVVTLARVVVSR